MSIVPVLLFEITQGETVRRFATADCYDGDVEYKGLVTAQPAIRDTFTEVYTGFLEHGDVTVELSDQDGEIKELLWGVSPLDLRGARATLIRADFETTTKQINHLVAWEEDVSWEDGASWEAPYTKTTDELIERFGVSGRVDRVDYEDVVRVNVSFRDPDELSKVLCSATITADLFEDAPSESLGKPINILFGRCTAVPLYLIKRDYDNNEDHYLVGWGVTESNDTNKDTTVNLYRNDLIVGDWEEGLTVHCHDGSEGSPFPGFATVVFTGNGWEQKDPSGNDYTLTADWYGLELGGSESQRNFVEVIRHVLSDSTWGLGLTVDFDSFDAAAAVTDIAALKCDGAVTSQKRAKEITDALGFCCRGRLSQDADGVWFISVDGEYVSESAGTFSTAEGNIVTAGPRYRPSGKDAIKTLQYEYARKADGSYEFITSARTVNADFGEDKVERLDFVRDKETADRIACWNQRLHLYTAERVDLVLGQDAKTLNAGDVISLSVPRLNIGVTGTNLVPHGDMEADSGWSSYGSPTVNERSSEQAHGGTYSRKFTVNSNQQGIWSSYYVVEAGKHYRCRVWVYPVDWDNVQVSIRKGDNSAYVDYTNHTGLTLNQWNLIEVEYDEPVGGDHGYIRVSSYNRTSGTWFVDDVTLVELLSDGEYRVIDLERGLEGFTATAAAYSNKLYTYDPGTLPGDVESGAGADYSRTKPSAPTSPAVHDSGTLISVDGKTFSFFVVQAVKGAVNPSNFAKIIFGCRKHGETTYRWQDGEDAGSGVWRALFDSLTPGLLYDFAAKAVNNFSLESSPVTLGNQLAPGDTGKPASPTAVSVVADTRGIVLTWQNPSNTDFSHVGVWWNTSGATPDFGTAPAWTFSGGPGKKGSHTHRATASYTAHHYWIRAFDFTGNPSSTAGVYMGSATPEKVTGTHIAEATINTAHIDYVNAQKIKSGQITSDVSISLAGGADISMFSKTAGSDPAEIRFIGGSNQIATIWGDEQAGSLFLTISPLVAGTRNLWQGLTNFPWLHMHNIIYDSAGAYWRIGKSAGAAVVNLVFVDTDGMELNEGLELVLTSTVSGGVVTDAGQIRFKYHNLGGSTYPIGTIYAGRWDGIDALLIAPEATDQYDLELGIPGLEWQDLWVHSINGIKLMSGGYHVYNGGALRTGQPADGYASYTVVTDVQMYAGTVLQKRTRTFGFTKGILTYISDESGWT